MLLSHAWKPPTHSFSHFHGFNAEKYHFLNTLHLPSSLSKLSFSNIFIKLSPSLYNLSTIHTCIFIHMFKSSTELYSVTHSLGICSGFKKRLIQKNNIKKKLKLRVHWDWRQGISILLSNVMGKIFKELTHDQNGDWHFCCMVGIVDGFINKLGI